MNQCINNIVSECDLHPKKRAKVVKAPIWSDVKKYFASPNECSIRVVFLDSNNDGSHTDIVKYKQYDDCTQYFFEAGKYYYVYIRLLRNMLVWSAHPMVSGVEGVIGHHVSIGNKGRDASATSEYIDVHETMYTAEQIKKYHIIARKKKRDYFVDQRAYHLRSNNEPPPHYAPIIWDSILRYMNLGDSMLGGMGKSHLLPLVTNKNPRPHMNVDDIFAKITEHMNRVVPSLEDPDVIAILRIPYVPENKEASIKKRLFDMNGSGQNKNIRSLMLVSDHTIEYSALGVNLLPVIA